MWRARSLCISLYILALGVAEELPSASIAQGRIQGILQHSRKGRQFSAFQGIPYAAAPVGELRFEKPQPPPSWEGMRNASEAGQPCIQLPFTTRAPTFGSEDCLYLNVYTHQVTNEAKLPVLVWIHGGSYVEGYGHLYQPNYLMDNDIVLVTINYRLGALGFLSLEDKDLPGNYGLKDQVAALRWVQQNIAQFGGDPGTVTIFGESAGAASVHFHMMSPQSKGLFHRGISQSGSAFCPQATQGAGRARDVSERFAAHLGCNHHSTRDTLACLRDIPAYVMAELTHDFHDWHLDPTPLFPPAVEPPDTDEAFLTFEPWSLPSDPDIPWITGFTSAEGAFKAKTLAKKHVVELNDDFEIIGPVTLMFESTAEDPVRTAFAIKKFYFFDGEIDIDNSFENLQKMYSDGMIIYPGLEAFRRHGGPKYLYYFDYRGANSLVPEYQGVSHFDDLAYFFPMNKVFKDFNDTTEDREISEKLIDMWVNFATSGKPTPVDSWVQSGPLSEFLHIKKDGFVMAKDLLKERMDFWSTLPYRNKYSSTIKDEL